MSLREILAGKAVVEIGLRNKIEKGLKAISGRLRKFSTGIRSLSGAFSAAGGTAVAGLGTPLVAVGSVFANFDGKMAEVAAISGVAGQALTSLRDKAKLLGATTRFSATEAAGAMVYLSMAGMSAEEILTSVDAVLSVAAAGMLDLGRAADIVSDATTAFNLAADQTTRVANVMARTATSSNTSIEQMGDAFTYAAAQGAAAGQTVEDVSAAIGILGNAGLKASVAGSGIQGMFKRMISPEAETRLRGLGISIADAAGNIRPLSQLMVELRARTAAMTQIQRLKTFEGIFGLHAKSAVVLSQNADALAKLTTELQNSDGAAASLAAKMQNSLLGAFTSLRSATEGILIELGEALKGPAEGFITAVTEISRAFTTLVAANKPLFTQLAKIALIAGTVGAVLVALGGAGFALSLIVSGLATLTGFMGVAIGALLSPTGLAISAFAALYAMSGQFRNAIAQLLAPLLPTFNALQTTVSNFGSIFGQTWSGVIAAISSGDLAGAGTIAMAGLQAAFWQGVADIGKVSSTILDMLSSWVPGLDSLRNYVGQVFASMGQAILAGRWDLAGAILMKKLQIAVTSGWSKVTSMWTLFSYGLVTVFDQIGQAIKTAWRSMVYKLLEWVIWLDSKTFGVVAAGTQKMLNQMQSEAEAEDDRQAARRDAARMQAMQKKLDASKARQDELNAQLSALESEVGAAASDAGVTTLDERAAKARSELNAAIKNATENAAKQGTTESQREGVRAALAGGVNQTTRKVSSQGTFSASAAALFGLGSSKPQEETAKNTRQMLSHLKSQARKKPAQPAFGS